MENLDKEKYAPGFIYEDVEGAPFRIGQWVQFVGRADNSISKFGIGRVGKVAVFLYSGLSGETYPHDPFILVHDLPHDMYWQEELRALTDEEIAAIVEVTVEVMVEDYRLVTEIEEEKHFAIKRA